MGEFFLPYGVKGIGAQPIIPTAAAVANAVNDAIGVSVRITPDFREDLQVSPERA